MELSPNNNWPTQDVLERAVEMAFEINEAMGDFPAVVRRGGDLSARCSMPLSLFGRSGVTRTSRTFSISK